MAHRGTTFSSDMGVLEKVLKRDVDQVGRFSPQSTAEDVADALSSEITGKTVIITGVAPSGLGAEAARVIFKHRPRLLILASRTRKAIQETVVAIGGLNAENIRAVGLDLSDLDSVRSAATEILGLTPVVDVLINNAGIMMIPEYKRTKQGIELQFGVNHVGHFLLTNLIMSALLDASSGPVVVNISSSGHRASRVHLDDVNFDNGKAYEPFVAYGQSKTANILFGVSLAYKLGKKGLRSFAVDPGSVGTTGLNRQISFETKVANGWWNADGTLNNEMIPWTSVGVGAASYIVAAFDPKLREHNGKCLAKANIDETTESFATDPETAEALWILSEKLVEQEFRYD